VSVSNKHINKLIFLLLISFSQLSWGQDKKTFKDVVSINGYVKLMPSVSFVGSNSMLTNNYIHNRINTEFFISNKLSAKFELRNQIYYGETVKNTPNFGSLIDNDTGLIDLSTFVIKENSIVFLSNIDRLYFDYQGKKWEARLGRQRINWGINMAWNSNDLFNTYNIANFDYQERPGTDAVRFQYYTGDFSHLEIAYKPERSLDQSIVAGLFKFNKWKYDIQFLGGNYYTDVALGTGWAGNIKNAGFKGEATYFHNKSNFTDTSGVANISLSIDYSFKKGLYVNGSFLINTKGQNSNLALSNNFLFGNLSPKNLMPTKYSYLVQLMGNVNPSLKTSLITIYGQGMNLLFLMPSLDYEIKSNWNLSLIGQVIYGDFQNKFKNLGNSVYLRLWYSF